MFYQISILYNTKLTNYSNSAEYIKKILKAWEEDDYLMPKKFCPFLCRKSLNKTKKTWTYRICQISLLQRKAELLHGCFGQDFLDL